MTIITLENLLNKLFRSSRPEVFSKKDVLETLAKFIEKHLCQSLFLSRLQAQACNFIKKGPLVQVFSCGFCEISRTSSLLNTSGQLHQAIPEPFFMVTCVPFYNAAGNLDVYSMFQRFSSLDSSKI